MYLNLIRVCSFQKKHSQTPPRPADPKIPTFKIKVCSNFGSFETKFQLKFGILRPFLLPHPSFLLGNSETFSVSVLRTLPVTLPLNRPQSWTKISLCFQKLGSNFCLSDNWDQTVSSVSFGCKFRTADTR